ncbi:MAG: arginine--tRNA ligase [Anaerolineaceae bacterium]|nr:arginine--tRNA ligase [Anaerolineaceae bacterium]MBN2676488.1 arginine--tRNA ligase [Anaerolineaceae bacterium]
MFEDTKKEIAQRINTICRELDLPELKVQWAWIPFAGQWGIATSFFKLASEDIKHRGTKKPVPQYADEIAHLVADKLGIPDGFDRVETINGYLNLYFQPGEYTRKVLDATLTAGAHYGAGDPNNLRVMVEFSQPNTHKAFHVGHLRTLMLGAAVSNILEFAGWEVVRANYIGDIGLHVMKWMWNYLTNHNGEEPGEDRIRWLGDIYTEADNLFHSDPAIENAVRALFGRWEKRDSELVALWEKTRHWSLEGFDEIYRMMGVKFDHVFYESEEEQSGKSIVEDLIIRGIARDDRPTGGSVYIPLDELAGTKEKYRVLVILRSDGSSLYATKDIPLTIKKMEQFSLDRAVWVVDVRQALYLSQIFKTIELMGYPWANNLYHLAYEIVNLPGNVTISSREGAVVLLEDLVREATRRARQIVDEKNPELVPEMKDKVASAVALGSIKYPMVSRESGKVVTFDWESALDINDQTAPYMQYACVRAGSILRKAGGLPSGETPVPVDLHPAEITLVDLIARLPDEVQKAATDYKPMTIANLAYDLAKAFNDFYQNCPVLQADELTRNFRLKLTAASRQAISNCLFLLGITTPEVM